MKVHSTIKQSNQVGALSNFFIYWFHLLVILTILLISLCFYIAEFLGRNITYS